MGGPRALARFLSTRADSDEPMGTDRNMYAHANIRHPTIFDCSVDAGRTAIMRASLARRKHHWHRPEPCQHWHDNVRSYLRDITLRRRLWNDINIDDDDVFNSGAAVTAFCGALALASGVSLGLLFLSLFRSARSSKRSIATRTLSWQGGFLAVSTAGLFAALVAMTDFVANGEAKVSASVNGIAVPTVVVRGLQRALGVTTVYHEISYCKYCDAFLHMCFRPSPSRCSETRRYSTVDCAPFRDNLKYPLLRRCAKCLGR